MQAHIQTLITYLRKKDFKALLAFYQHSSDTENIDQLAFIYQQALKSGTGFEFYQQIATKFIATKGLPEALISQCYHQDALSFFTPALKLNSNFAKTNQLKRNPLHYVLVGTPHDKLEYHACFNYLRAMLLFESNEALINALQQRDNKNLTPIEAYLMVNRFLKPLPPHEFSALLALIEIETKQQPIVAENYIKIISALKLICQRQRITITPELQRVLLIAAYYGKSASEVCDHLSV